MKTVQESKQINNPDKWIFLASTFEREGACVGETKLTVNINGVYSIPEEWLKLEASGAVDNWYYQALVSDVHFEEGKTNPRELTEDEKKELENKKNSKNPPKGGKKEEISAAELERLERERIEKEERERKLQEELSALDERTRFYREKENPTKESWISFPNGKNEESVIKTGEKLIDLEEDINTNYGFYIEFFKIPPPEEDSKKPKPKPKNISADELKPIYCVGWIDLSEFHKTPGLKEITQRVPLELKETFEKRNQIEEEIAKALKENGETSELEAQLHNLSDYVTQKETYIYLKITINPPINPAIPEKRIPNPFDLIKKEDKPYKQITADEICSDFRKQLKIAIAAIAKQYEEFANDSKNNLIKRDKGNVISNAKKEERDNNITKFLYNFNVSGKAELLKEKLKKFIVRIVREKYKKRTNVKGIFKDDKDQFYSELFAYLTDEVKLSMDEFVYLKKDELHGDVASSYEQSRKEVMQYAVKLNKEPEEKRLLRLSKEYEIMDDLEKAMFYYKARLTLNQSKESWSTYAVLAKKTGELKDCEEAIINCIEIEPDDINYKILYSAIKWIKGRSTDAIHFLLAIIEDLKGIKNTNCNLNAFLAFLYKDLYLSTKDKNKDLLFKKHLEAALRFKLKDSGLTQYLGKRNPKSKENKKLPDEYKDQISDQIYFSLCSMFNIYNLFEVSEKILEYLIVQKNTTKYKLEQAKILIFKKEYDKVIHLVDEIVNVEKANYTAWILRGNAYYYKQNLFDSEESYIRAVRCKPDRNERFDLQMLFQLGMTYIKRKTWKDAKTVFLQILKENPGYSFAWRYLGLSLMKLEEYTSAEEALNEANLLDVENPTIWGYLCIYCILVDRHFQAFECLNELMKMNFKDVDLLEEIAILFCKKGESNVGAEIYNKILLIQPNNVDIHLKLAGVYLHIDSRKYEALELLKNRLRVTEDENDRKKINKFIEFINKEIGMSTGEQIGDVNLSLEDRGEDEDEIKPMPGVESINLSKYI